MYSDEPRIESNKKNKLTNSTSITRKTPSSFLKRFHAIAWNYNTFASSNWCRSTISFLTEESHSNTGHAVLLNTADEAGLLQCQRTEKEKTVEKPHKIAMLKLISKADIYKGWLATNGKSLCGNFIISSVCRFIMHILTAYESHNSKIRPS